MILVSPIREEELKAWIGRPVCAVLQDGSEHPGILSRTDGGKIILNEPAGLTISTKPKHKGRVAAKSPIKGNRKHAVASPDANPLAPFEPGPSLTSIGPKSELVLSNVALLFPLMI